MLESFKPTLTKEEFFKAVVDPDLEKLQATLKLAKEEGFDINCKNGDGSTALHHAAINNSAAAIRELLGETRFNAVNAVDGFGCTALHLAARNNHVEAIRELLGEAGRKAGINVNAANHFGQTALHLAAINNSAAAIRELLGKTGREAGFNVVNAVDRNGSTALHHAAISNRNSAAAIQELLGEAGRALGIDVNAVDDDGYTALHHAVMYNKAEDVQALLANQEGERAREAELEEGGAAAGGEDLSDEQKGRYQELLSRLTYAQGLTEEEEKELSTLSKIRSEKLKSEAPAAAVDTPDVTPSDPRVINVNAGTKTPPRGR